MHWLLLGLADKLFDSWASPVMLWLRVRVIDGLTVKDGERVCERVIVRDGLLVIDGEIVKESDGVCERVCVREREIEKVGLRVID